MARKITPKDKPAASAQADAGGDDLSILYPDREVIVGGRTLTVREYGFMEGLALQPLAAPIIDALVAAAMDKPEESLETILDILAEDPARMNRLVAEACIAPAHGDEEKHKRAAQVDALIAELEDPAKVSDGDGQALLMTWWTVNSGFFVRRVVRRLAVRRAMAAQAKALTEAPAGATSSSASSSTDTPSANSAATRAVN